MTRVRFAPSPTWTLHVGNALSAVANRRFGDWMLLRIDDTDPARNVPGGEEELLLDLEWLGLEGDEGTFSICTFWYVEALARAGFADEARLAFEKMLTYGNHLGLYSEEIGPSGEALGNFPQAFTHLSLISAAVNLDRQLG